MYKTSKPSSSSGSGSTRHGDKSRFNVGTFLIEEEEFKQGLTFKIQ